MDKNYSNLKSKTFLDFTEDKAIIGKIIGESDTASFSKVISEYGRYITFLKFAEFTNNSELANEVEKQLGSIANE